MRNGGAPNDWKVIPLAADAATVFASPDPEGAHIGQPSLVVLPSGRMIAALDEFGPGVRNLPGAKGKLERLNRWIQGKIYTSNDKGQTWTSRHDFPFSHPCLFRDGSTLYLIGHADRMQIIKSSDGGETWSKPVELTPPGEIYAHAPANVTHFNGHIRLVMMRVCDPTMRGDPVSTLAPILMKAPEGSNLTARKSWVFSDPPRTFKELVPEESLDYFGVPFFSVPDPLRGADVGNKRWAHRIGWGDAHAVHISAPHHYWHDPTGRTTHILARAACHRGNVAAMAVAVEEDDGRISVRLQTTPAGKPVAFVPLPGGNLKFSLLYDEVSALYWLASNQVTDSLTRAAKLPANRYRLPCDEENRLQLHFSKNLVDWSFAGFLLAGANAGESRHSPCLAVRGNDLCALVCTGAGLSRNPHDVGSITCHTVPNFRELIY